MNKKKHSSIPLESPKKNKFLLPSLLSVGLICFGLGYFIGNQDDPVEDSNPEVRQKGYVFINPLIECRETPNKRFNKFSSDLRDEIKAYVEKNSTFQISVFYRDLNNGPTVSINPKLEFMPASLVKVPVMMAYYKHAEDHPEILEKQLTYSRADQEDYSVIFQPEKKLSLGDSYPVKELIERMILYSDNPSKRILVEDIFKNAKSNDGSAVSLYGYSNIFDALVLSSPDTPNHVMRAKEVSAFFRVLFNASYLNRKYSEDALNLLSRSTFKKGIARLLPTNMKVSHKFGENDLGNQREFHDCGIVYYPKYPYLLCVMTRGDSTERQAQIVSDISRIVFDKTLNFFKK